MSRKYLAFDIETAADIPGPDFNWRPHRPIGITCAAAYPSDADEPIIWHGKNSDGTPARRMSRDEARHVVDQLCEMVANAVLAAGDSSVSRYSEWQRRTRRTQWRCEGRD